MRVMVVDDEAIPLLALEQLLLDKGHQVKLASTAEEAIDIGLQFKPALIISDWNLEDAANGVEICRFLKSRLDVQIILVSGSRVADVLKSCEDLDTALVCSKPLDEDALLRKIAEIASQRNDDDLPVHKSANFRQL